MRLVISEKLWLTIVSMIRMRRLAISPKRMILVVSERVGVCGVAGWCLGVIDSSVGLVFSSSDSGSIFVPRKFSRELSGMRKLP